MDLDILLFFQSIRTEALTAWMSAATWLGSETVFVPVLCIILWCIRKELGYRMGLTLFFSLGLNQTMKVLFSVPRPWMRWPDRITPVASAVADATGYSFPSGHTGTAATIYPTLAMRALPRNAVGPRVHRIRIFGYVGAALALLLVGASRIYLGVHTPSDVLVSALLTLAVVVPANLIYDQVEQGKVPDRTVLFGGLAMAAAVFAVATVVVLQDPPEDTEHALDAFKAAGAMAGFAAGWFIERRWIRFEVGAALPVQALKILVGISILLTVQTGMKPLLHALIPWTPLAEALRYALVALWATCGLPALAGVAARAVRRTPITG